MPATVAPVSATGAGARPLSRVPAVTPAFWLVKVLTTGIGETTSDALVHRFPGEVVVPAAVFALAAMLVVQGTRRRLVPSVYWLTALMVSIVGTMLADTLHVVLAVPYASSTAAFAAGLAVVLALWYRSERTVSVHAITTPRRERFYWATVIATFALGTAAGDLTAGALGLGYAGSIVVFGALIALPAIGRRWLHLGGVVTFWAAYVLTRPLGASIADAVAAAPARGGLGVGPLLVSVAGLSVFAVCVALISASSRAASSRATVGAR